MKRAEHYLKSEIATMYLTPLQFDGIIRAIIQAKKEAYNQAIDDAAETCEDFPVVDELGEYTDDIISVTEKSDILKLKK